MAIIVPTITAQEPHAFRAQIERVQNFALRIHIDFMDGTFTPNKSIPLNQMFKPVDSNVDLHLMTIEPYKYLQEIIELNPNLVIIPTESKDSIQEFVKEVNDSGIKCGVSIMPGVEVDSISQFLDIVQHVTIFSGNLGYQGGSVADLSLLNKVEEILRCNPAIEIGWDGGINDANTAQIAQRGVDVLNVGGYIQSAPDAGVAYNTLDALLP